MMAAPATTAAEAPGDGVVRTTAYVSMLPYAYTTSDVAQLFAPFGKLARVLVLRDKLTRRSRGVAFVQFARPEDCARAVAGMDGTTLEGMTLAVSLCRDNGRAGEFAKKRTYAKTKRCFECGEHGHVSYDCPRNMLGARDKPVASKKPKKKKKFDPHELKHFFNAEGTTNLLAPPLDSEEDLSLSLLAYPSKISVDSDALAAPSTATARRTRKPSAYFSDEDPSDDEG